MQEHLKLLGLKVRDAVTGFEGIVASITFDLYGCIQAIVQPAWTGDEKKFEARWFDAKRLKILDSEPVMAVPDFAVVAGGEAHSLPPNKPLP